MQLLGCLYPVWYFFLFFPHIATVYVVEMLRVVDFSPFWLAEMLFSVLVQPITGIMVRFICFSASRKSSLVL